MPAMSRLLLLPAVLMLAGTSFAQAESPIGDPVPPAVVGRPLEQIRPAAARPKPVPAKTAKATTKPKPKAAATASAATATMGAGAAAPSAAGARPAKQAVDDRGDPRMRTDDVGKGTRFANKRMGPGAYFAEKHRIAVRSYYDRHFRWWGGGKSNWQIGEPVPRDAKLAAVPSELLPALPKVPPGHQYLQVGGEVVLVAAESRMVVDGISRKP